MDAGDVWRRWIGGGLEKKRLIPEFEEWKIRRIQTRMHRQRTTQKTRTAAKGCRCAEAPLARPDSLSSLLFSLRPPD
jgi:hypothetical protein